MILLPYTDGILSQHRIDKLSSWDNTEQMEELERKIEEASKKKVRPNYELADLLREKIRMLGYDIEDTPTGTRIWRIKVNG